MARRGWLAGGLIVLLLGLTVGETGAALFVWNVDLPPHQPLFLPEWEYASGVLIDRQNARREMGRLHGISRTRAQLIR